MQEPAQANPSWGSRKWLEGLSAGAGCPGPGQGAEPPGVAVAQGGTVALGARELGFGSSNAHEAESDGGRAGQKVREPWGALAVGAAPGGPLHPALHPFPATETLLGETLGPVLPRMAGRLGFNSNGSLGSFLLWLMRILV